MASSLKGQPETIVKLIAFELQNAGQKVPLSGLIAQFPQDVALGSSGYQGIPMFTPNSQQPPSVDLATAKFIVEVERVEYQNVIRAEKAARAMGETSLFSDSLSGGASASWSSFAKYLHAQCQAGHYLNIDPNSNSPSWNGWLFVTAADYEDKDPLA